MRSAVIDLGSNTFHLLVADVDARGTLREVLDSKVAVRAGAGAFEGRRIPEETLRRGVEAFGMLLADAAGEYDRLRVVATGIFREAENALAFLDELRELYRVEIELLGGEDEARLTWLGVRSELPPSAGRLAVIDIGGGSVECVAGEHEVEFAKSLPLGVLRMRDRLEDEPEPLRRLRGMVIDAAEPTVKAVSALEPDTVAFSSGTARALLRVARELGHPEDLPRRLGRQSLIEISNLLAVLSPELDELGVDFSRRDTIAIGSVIVTTFVEMLGPPFVYVAKRALREGVLLDGLDPAERAAAS